MTGPLGSGTLDVGTTGLATAECRLGAVTVPEIVFPESYRSWSSDSKVGG